MARCRRPACGQYARVGSTSYMHTRSALPCCRECVSVYQSGKGSVDPVRGPLQQPTWRPVVSPGPHVTCAFWLHYFTQDLCGRSAAPPLLPRHRGHTALPAPPGALRCEGHRGTTPPPRSRPVCARPFGERIKEGKRHYKVPTSLLGIMKAEGEHAHEHGTRGQKVWEEGRRPEHGHGPECSLASRRRDRGLSKAVGVRGLGASGC